MKICFNFFFGIIIFGYLFWFFICEIKFILDSRINEGFYYFKCYNICLNYYVYVLNVEIVILVLFYLFLVFLEDCMFE